MITGLSIVTVWVLDRDSAKKFYTEQLGFTLTNDIELESGMRWLTVRPPGSENQELLLLDPLHSMLDEESAQQVRALIAKGALSPGVMATSDCKGDHATLAERGGPAPIPGCYALMWRAGLPEPGCGERITSREASAPGRAVQSRHEPQAHHPGA